MEFFFQLQIFLNSGAVLEQKSEVGFHVEGTNGKNGKVQSSISRGGIMSETVKIGKNQYQK